MGTTPVPPPPKRGSFPLKTPRKESPRGDEQDAVCFVLLRAFYAENDVDQCVVSATRTALRGGRAQVAGLMSRGRTASRYSSTRKRHENKLRSRQKAHHSKAHRKLCKRMVWAYGFMLVFCFFQGRTSPTTRGSRGVRGRRSRRLQHENRPFLDGIGR